MRLRGTGLFLLCFLMVFGSACDKSRFERIKKHVDTALALMPVARAVVSELNADGTLDSTATEAITIEIDHINLALTEFKAVAHTQGEFTAESRVQLLKLAATIADSAKRLNDSGALHIKNPKKKEQFSRTCRAISVSAGIIYAMISESEPEPESADEPETTPVAPEGSGSSLEAGKTG